MRPYTTCSAVEHGWIWKIPNQSRIGTGLVFNRSITDIDEAKEFLLTIGMIELIEILHRF